MSQDLTSFLTGLRAKKPRLAVSDPDLLEAAWQAHPRLYFFKSLPWGWNVLDAGAGSGGLTHWKGWLKPNRADLNLYGVDRHPGEFREFYAGWETLDLDREMPQFSGVDFNGFIAAHLIEYLDAPERLIAWLGERVKPGARTYLEWTGPSSLDLPGRDQLSQHGIEVLTSNFIDDREHKEAPDLASVERWLGDAGFDIIASGAVDLGILGEELFARGADRDSRSMGYWSLTRSSLYTVAIKSAAAIAKRRGAAGVPGLSEQAAPVAAAQPADIELHLLHAKRALLVSGLFDAAFYGATYADMRNATIDPLTHYLTQGEAEGRSPNAVFAPRYYRRHWMKGLPADQNALLHYIEEGERGRAKPHPAFDPQAYLGANPPLAEFVDRPLFHYLKLGRAAGLSVAPGPQGEKLARVLEAQPHAIDFESSGQRDHAALMRYKQALVRELGTEAGFSFYRDLFDLPDSGRVERKPVTSLYDFAKEGAATFRQIDPGGEPFNLRPPRVIGDGNHKPLEGTSRAIFVTCLIDARVRARSGLIDIAGSALIDFQGDELSRIDDELDFDPAVFHGEQDAVWLIGPREDTDTVEIDEAFMLFGPLSDGFGNWLIDLLPRYIAASASGALPPVPVLIDASMPARQRECLQMMLAPETPIIELPAFAAARVRRLWCASSQRYSAVQPRINERWRWDYHAIPAERFAAIVREMTRRIESQATETSGPERIYIKASSDARHALVNSAEIEAAASERGFSIISPSHLSFSEQARVLRSARYIVVPDASNLPLGLLASPGTQLCHLSHRFTAGLVIEADFLRATGVDVTILTGPPAGRERREEGVFDYRIDPGRFGNFLDDLLRNRSSAVTPILDGVTCGVISYWDKSDPTAIKEFLAEWRSAFRSFTLLGDGHIEPIIEELFPDHLEMFRRIRIPTCKSDLALLLGLYKLGGLYVDCHCGICDAEVIRQLFGALSRSEVMLYDRSRTEEPRPSTQIFPLNSVIYARPNSTIILEAAAQAFRKLREHWVLEQRYGFQPYDIWSLTGPGNLAETLLIDVASPVWELRADYASRVRFISEGEGEPIKRYVHYEYRAAGMHWSERQLHELLFDASDRASQQEQV